MTASHRSLRDSPDDRLLVIAMRAPEPHPAIEEFYRRVLPGLLDLARRQGVDPADRRTLATDVLTDVVVALSSPTAPVPRSIAAYLAIAFRNGIQSRRRAEERRARREAGGRASMAGSVREGSAGATPPHPEDTGCSEYTQYVTDSPDMERSAVEPAVQRLADALADQIGEDDRKLLLWLGHGVPARLAAEWLGIGYDAAVKRASRLRGRLRAAAIEHALQLTGPERRAVHQFLRRAGVILLTSAPEDLMPATGRARARPRESRSRRAGSQAPTPEQHLPPAAPADRRKSAGQLLESEDPPR